MQKLKQWFFWKEIFNRKKQIEITVETKQTIQIYRISKKAKKFCLLCRTESLFLTISESIPLVEIDVLKMEILLARGNIHFIKSPDDKILICFNSLKMELKKEDKRTFEK